MKKKMQSKFIENIGKNHIILKEKREMSVYEQHYAGLNEAVEYEKGN